MGHRHRTWVLALVICLTAGTLGAETVVLQDGRSVTGEILKSDDDAVVVDLGFTVLRLPRAQVVRVEKPQADSDDAAAPAEDEAPAERLYRTADLKPTTIERNVERFGEAVVMVSTPQGQGSGFLLNGEGYLITNYHVIAQEKRIKVTVFREGEDGFEKRNYKKVRILALNPFVDLALLKIQIEDEAGHAEPFTYVYLGDVRSCKAGNRVFAIGNPLGLTRTVSQGIISTTNRNFSGRLYIQTTADINPGNSGGPLFNRKGEVIGMTSMGYVWFGGLNFAIPVDVVKRFIANRDAFAYDADNPNHGYRYLQPGGREEQGPLPKAPAMPTVEAPGAAR